MSPHFVGPVDLAREMGVALNSVYKAEGTGRIRRHENGKFDLEKAKKDWRDNTHPRKGGKHEKSTDHPHIRHKPLLNFWLQLFNDSAGPTAILLKQQTDLGPKDIWNLLGTAFLIQWEVIAGMLVNGEELPLELSSVAKMLADDEGKKKLTAWLERN